VQKETYREAALTLIKANKEINKMERAWIGGAK
jgi:hypothetical protein